jgi:ABC-2 type transport system permease protein
LNLATLTTRFVYPQFSLEGKRLWIVGMAPLGMMKILMTKFWMAACGALAVTLGLIVLSCHMLKLSWERTSYFAMAVTVMTFTLTALAVGLGALYPNLKEDNPSKVVSGFGGTFCLVLSFLYILGSVLTLAFGSTWGGPETSPIRPYACLAAFLIGSAALGAFPLGFGLRRVRNFEL